MAKAKYLAFFEPDDSGFSVWFPDLDGCTSGGSSFEDAIENAEQALALHLQGMAEDGISLPVPTLLENIPDYHGPGTEIIVRIEAEAPGKKVRINVMLDEGLVAAIDAAAPNRSKFLSDAARKALNA